MQKLKAEIEIQFVRHLEEHPFWKQVAQESPAEFLAIRSTLLAPGKRLRPHLFCTACLAAGCDPIPDLMPAALALELAHEFILVHDDIIDRSDERRGAPTLPKQIDTLFAQHPADGFSGSDFALITGDLLYTLAIESLLQTKTSDAQKTAAIRLFTQAATDTGRGALLEMHAAQTPPTDLTIESIEKIYALKTGSYTFALPLQLAACFTGMQELSAVDFAQIGTHAGIAFQLRNDLANSSDDLRDARRTWALVCAGSKRNLNDPAVQTAVKNAFNAHRQQALDLTEHLPAIQNFLRQTLVPVD